jgi:hypothetical protein
MRFLTLLAVQDYWLPRFSREGEDPGVPQLKQPLGTDESMPPLHFRAARVILKA